MPIAPNILALKKVCLNPAASRYPTLQLSVVFFWRKVDDESNNRPGVDRFV